MKVSISKSYISLIGLEEEEIRYYLRDFAFKVEFFLLVLNILVFILTKWVYEFRLEVVHKEKSISSVINCCPKVEAQY